MQNRLEVLLFGQPDPTTTGPWQIVKVNAAGVVSVGLSNAAGQLILNEPADALNPTANNNVPVFDFGMLYNGSTWDQKRGNNEVTVLPSAARTVTTNSADFTNYNNTGLHLVINVSAITATPSITPTIQGKDPISGTYYTVLTGLPITTTGINIIKVYPGISAVVNASASDILPRTWRLNMAHADADSITYSVAGVLIV